MTAQHTSSHVPLCTFNSLDGLDLLCADAAPKFRPPGRKRLPLELHVRGVVTLVLFSHGHATQVGTVAAVRICVKVGDPTHSGRGTPTTSSIDLNDRPPLYEHSNLTTSTDTKTNGHGVESAVYTKAAAKIVIRQPSAELLARHNSCIKFYYNGVKHKHPRKKKLEVITRVVTVSPCSLACHFRSAMVRP